MAEYKLKKLSDAETVRKAEEIVQPFLEGIEINEIGSYGMENDIYFLGTLHVESPVSLKLFKLTELAKDDKFFGKILLNVMNGQISLVFNKALEGKKNIHVIIKHSLQSVSINL